MLIKRSLFETYLLTAFVVTLLLVAAPAIGEVVIGAELIYTVVHDAYDTGKNSALDCKALNPEYRSILINGKVQKDIDAILGMCTSACRDGRNKLSKKTAMNKVETYLLKTYGPPSQIKGSGSE